MAGWGKDTSQGILVTLCLIIIAIFDNYIYVNRYFLFDFQNIFYVSYALHFQI